MAGSSQAANGRIYISRGYDDWNTDWLLDKLYADLTRRFGRGCVVTRSGLEPIDKVPGCLLVLITPRWLNLGIKFANDWVRVNILKALQQGIPVVSVLLDGAVLPQAQDLPQSLRPLTQAQAFAFRSSNFPPSSEDPNFKQLVATLQATLTDSSGSVAEDPGTPKTRRLLCRPKDSLPRQTKIFLCYRREDTQGFAGRIYDNLASKYGDEQVFRDIDSIPAGIRYPTWIESRVSQCSVMIVLIGAAWSSSKDDTGQRRLDSPEDWVRQEIETALKRNVPMIPVLVQGARMPSKGELPPSIADLTEFENAEVTDRRWAYDVQQIIQAIDNLSGSE